MGKFLAAIPLLVNTPEHQRNLLGGALVNKKFSRGATVIKQGDPGDGFYFIASGDAKVVYTDQDKKTCVVAYLSDTDYFGEAALINDKARGASVIATTSLKTLYLSKRRFEALVSSGQVEIQFTSRRRAVHAERNPDQKTHHIEEIKKPANAVIEKNSAQLSMINNVVDTSALFQGLAKAHKQLVVGAFYRQSILSGTSVIQQGQPGINFYCVESGNFEILRSTEGKTAKVVDSGRGTYFGDVALLHSTKRNATCTATEDSIVWILNRYVFRHIIQEIGEARIKQYMSFMHEVTLLAPLLSSERSQLADALEELTFHKHDKVFSEGDEGDAMYFVVNGVCLAYKRDEKTGETVELATIDRGGYFGERALLNNDTRAASVKCMADTFLLKLDRAAFERTLGPLEELLKRQVDSYESAPKEAEEVEILDKSIRFEDLKHVGNLGQGAFGTVTLVRHTKTQVTYALKAVSKAQIVETQQEQHILNEKKVMATVHHPFFVNLVSTFNNNNQVFFLLEPSMGGELFTTLRQHRYFPEKTARFYAAHVVLGFECLHKHSYIYRDLKPENLLLCADGYIKLTDFGFAKKCHTRCYTLCGTPEYLAPEIVAVPPTGHGKGVDWWCLGILIFEMLASYSPFYSDSFSRMYEKIKKGKIRFPSNVSTQSRAIISALLSTSVNKRLGVTKGGADNIKQHPWFNGFSWSRLLAKTLPAPIKPNIKNETDTSNFSRFKPNPVPAYNSSKTHYNNWDEGF